MKCSPGRDLVSFAFELARIARVHGGNPYLVVGQSTHVVASDGIVV